MNKLTSVFFALCFVLFIGCSDDEEDFLTPLVGTWHTSSIESSGCSNPDENGTLTCTGVPCFAVTINSNGTYTLMDNTAQESEAGTVTVTSTQLTLCATEATDCSPVIYSLTGSSLTITFNDEDSPGCLFTTVFTKQ